MNHLMVDIETLDNKSNSVIVSIGALEFDIETGATGKEFFQTVNIQSCIDLGLTINGSTLSWWMGQNDEARKQFTEANISIQKALLNFYEFCNGKDYFVWGNSASFDLGIMSDAYVKIGQSIPWDFRKERCLRTLVSFNEDIKKNWISNGVAHNAISDCYNQVGYACEIYKSLIK